MSDTRSAEAGRKQTSDAETPPEDADAGPQPVGHVPDYEPRYVPVESGLSGWIGIIVGAVLVLFMPRFWSWLSHVVLGTAFTWTFRDASGNPITYTQSIFFWGDLAVALMAVALIVDGLVLLLLRESRPAGWLAFGLVAVATLVNAGYLIFMLANGHGPQLFSLIAVLIGAFMSAQHWQNLRGPRRRYVMVEY